MAAAPMNDIEIGGYTFSRRRLTQALKRYASERVKPHKSWLTDETRRPEPDIVAAADLTEPVVLGQLIRNDGSAWVILAGLPQVLRAFQTGDALTLVRLSLKDTTKLVTKQPVGAFGSYQGQPTQLRSLLKRRQTGCNGCLDDFS